ncbi:hypothetical protein EJB05_46392, partial [Eragrostis curvula]
MASLHLLNHLNMSYNNISGKVLSFKPLVIKILTYMQAIVTYAVPLFPSCSEYKENPADHDEQPDDRDVLLYVFSGLGFGSGFAAVWWLLIFSKAVSKVYAQFIDSICEKVFDSIIILKVKLSRKYLGGNQNLIIEPA